MHARNIPMLKVTYSLFITLFILSCTTVPHHSQHQPSSRYPNMLTIKGVDQVDTSKNYKPHWDFLMSQFEITNAQYTYFLNEVYKDSALNAPLPNNWIFINDNNPIYRDPKNIFRIQKGFQNHPATQVTYLGTLAYTQWLSDKTLPPPLKRKYSYFELPHLSEWYYAASGNSSHAYAGSDSATQVAWYKGNTNTTQAVGQKQPNAFGLYDMSGNASEWCLDNPFSGQTYGILGGSYLSTQKDLLLSQDSLERVHFFIKSPFLSQGKQGTTVFYDSTRIDIGFRIVQRYPSPYEF